MTNMIDDGLAWLNEQRQASLTSTVTYRRGSDSVELLATHGQSSFVRIDKNGVGVKITQTDWLISAEDLVLNSVAVQPQKGDTINDGTHTFQVEPNPADGCWKWSGPGYYTMRVHSKEVS